VHLAEHEVDHGIGCLVGFGLHGARGDVPYFRGLVCGHAHDRVRLGWKELRPHVLQELVKGHVP